MSFSVGQDHRSLIRIFVGLFEEHSHSLKVPYTSHEYKYVCYELKGPARHVTTFI